MNKSERFNCMLLSVRSRIEEDELLDHQISSGQISLRDEKSCVIQ